MVWRQKLVMKWQSLDGRTTSMATNTQSNPDPGMGTLANVYAAIQAASVAGLVYAERQPVVVVSEAPVTGPYPSITDRAQILLRAADGSTGRAIIPAPLADCFQADGETVDFGDPLVIAVVNAYLANLCAPSGSPWVEAYSGKRMKLTIPR